MRSGGNTNQAVTGSAKKKSTRKVNKNIINGEGKGEKSDQEGGERGLTRQFDWLDGGSQIAAVGRCWEVERRRKEGRWQTDGQWRRWRGEHFCQQRWKWNEGRKETRGIKWQHTDRLPMACPLEMEKLCTNAYRLSNPSEMWVQFAYWSYTSVTWRFILSGKARKIYLRIYRRLL